MWLIVTFAPTAALKSVALSASHVSAGRTIGRLAAACVGEANDNPKRVQRMTGKIVLSKRVIRSSLLLMMGGGRMAKPMPHLPGEAPLLGYCR